MIISIQLCNELVGIIITDYWVSPPVRVRFHRQKIDLRSIPSSLSQKRHTLNQTLEEASHVFDADDVESDTSETVAFDRTDFDDLELDDFVIIKKKTIS